MFCQQSKTMDTIPPTHGALLQHAKQCVYQAGVWTTSDQSKQHIPTPERGG